MARWCFSQYSFNAALLTWLAEPPLATSSPMLVPSTGSRRRGDALRNPKHNKFDLFRKFEGPWTQTVVNSPPEPKVSAILFMELLLVSVKALCSGALSLSR